jgi:hypothetical protein
VVSPGFHPDQLIDEVAAVAALALGETTQRAPPLSRPLPHPSRRSIPLTCSNDALRTAAGRHVDLAFDDADRDTWLELLMSQVIEPKLGIDELSFVVDYPPSQAALARLRLDAEGQTVASRFELYHRGVELANGYHELLDADEQRARFAADPARARQAWPAGDPGRHPLPRGAAPSACRIAADVALGLGPPDHARRRCRFTAGGGGISGPTPAGIRLKLNGSAARWIASTYPP